MFIGYLLRVVLFFGAVIGVLMWLLSVNQVDNTLSGASDKTEKSDIKHTVVPGVLEEAVASTTLPTLSISVPEASLHDKESGILVNAEQRGQNWEREAKLTFSYPGQEDFIAKIGLRMHGDSSRNCYRQGDYCSYRIYFRSDYGTENFVPVIFKDQLPLKTLVLAHEKQNNIFVAPYAFDIARQMGGVAQEWLPVLFYLNGELQQSNYYLTEHLSRRQWKSRFGSYDFAFYRYRGNNDQESVALYEAFKGWLTSVPEGEMTLGRVSKRVNIDNFSRYVFSLLFLNTGDWNQGALVLDKLKRQGKWFWVHWDLDKSFNIKDAENTRNLFSEDDTERLIALGEDRKYLFIRLMKESPEYRQYFIKIATDILNHLATDSFLQDRLVHYENLSGMPQNKLRNFVKNRASFIRKYLSSTYGYGSLYSVSVLADEDESFTVDSYSAQGNYFGKYFDKMVVSISADKPIKHWLVNNQEITTEILVHPVTENTVIKPVYVQ